MSKKFTLKHYQLPITILWEDPIESFIKRMEIILKDMQKNGLKRWNVKEVIAKVADGTLEKENDICCPPAAPKIKQNATPNKFEV